MSNVLLLIQQFFSVIVSVILAFIPFSGSASLEKEDPNVRLTVAIVSDVHIDDRLPVGKTALKSIYWDMNKFDPDGVAVLGDLTNYGDYATTEKFFKITTETLNDGVQPVIISGNHDIGHAKEADGARLNPEALADFMDLCNKYLGYGIDKPAYTVEVNGYHFICLNDESADNWDHPEYSDESLAFLDSELAAYAVDGMPVFVCMHVPLSDIHGEKYFYEGGGVEEPWNAQIKTTLEKYDNVFCLTGHFHKGLSNDINTPTYVTVNGVHYLNLPSSLMPNWPKDYAINGLGFIMTVTDSAVNFRCRNYYMHNWYSVFDYSEPLV